MPLLTTRCALLACRTLLAATMFVGLLTSCKNDKDDPATDLFGTYDRRAMLTRIRDGAARPAFGELTAAADTLRLATQLLTAASTPAELASCQTAWLAAAKAWKSSELFAAFGPGEALNLAGSIGMETNPTVIDNALADSAPITQSYLDTRPAAAKGIWALEYLLFERGAQGNAAVLARLTTAPGADRRRAYLQALAAELPARTAAVRNEWTTGAYASAFVDADGNDVSSSLSLLVNASVQVVEAIKNERLGRPLGDLNGGTPQPETAEGYRSGTSDVFITQSLLSLDGVWAGAPGRSVLNGLLDHLGAQAAGGQPLSSAIADQLAATRARVSPDVASLVDQQRQPVVELQAEVKKLTVLLKAEAVSKLGVLLTFNDNDGD